MSGTVVGKNKLNGFLDSVATLATILVCALLAWTIWTQRQGSSRSTARATEPPPQDPITIDGAQTKGSPVAKAVMVLYSDFQCPFCGSVARDTLPEIEREFVAPGKLQLAFRHLPLTSIHPLAMKAAEAAECSGRQGKFWEMHDRLFERPSQLDGATLLAKAEEIGVRRQMFESCLAGELTAKIKADLDQATVLKVSVTPTFFIGLRQTDGRVRVLDRVAGGVPVQTLRDAINKVLSQQ